MRKRFADLSQEDIAYIKLRYKEAHNEEKYKEAIQYELANKFDVVPRTIRSWAKKLGVVNPPTKESNHNAKILVFDIETSPIQAFVWSLWKQNVSTQAIIDDWFMLTWSAKWLFEDEIMSDRLTGKEALEKNDKRIVQSLRDLLDEADIVIAHNGQKFDIKKLNTRILMNDIKQYSPFQMIDTLLHARKQLAFSSNKLDYLGEQLGVGRKVAHQGFEMWERCYNGEDQALIEMEEYNRGDVTLLEDVYLKLRSYIKPHPNLGLFINDDTEVCPACGSDDLEFGGTYATSVNTYQAYRCKCCDSQGRSRKSSSIGKSNLIAPIAR